MAKMKTSDIIPFSSNTIDDYSVISKVEVNGDNNFHTNLGIFSSNGTKIYVSENNVTKAVIEAIKSATTLEGDSVEVDTSSFTKSDWLSIFKACAGNNYDGTNSTSFILPTLFLSEEKVAKGYYPLTPVIVGNNYKIVLTIDKSTLKTGQPYILNFNYTYLSRERQANGLLTSFSLDDREYDVSSDYISFKNSINFSKKINAINTLVKSGHTINETEYKENIISIHNSKPKWNSSAKKLNYSKLFNSKTGSWDIIISTTPIILYPITNDKVNGLYDSVAYSLNEDISRNLYYIYSVDGFIVYKYDNTWDNLFFEHDEQYSWGYQKLIPAKTSLVNVPSSQANISLYDDTSLTISSLKSISSLWTDISKITPGSGVDCAEDGSYVHPSVSTTVDNFKLLSPALNIFVKSKVNPNNGLNSSNVHAYSAPILFNGYYMINSVVTNAKLSTEYISTDKALPNNYPNWTNLQFSNALLSDGSYNKVNVYGLRLGAYFFNMSSVAPQPYYLSITSTSDGQTISGSGFRVCGTPVNYNPDSGFSEVTDNNYYLPGYYSKYTFGNSQSSCTLVAPKWVNKFIINWDNIPQIYENNINYVYAQVPNFLISIVNGSTYHGVSATTYFDTNDTPYDVDTGLTTEHWYDVITPKAEAGDILLANDVDNMIDQAYNYENSLDEVSSEIINWANQLPDDTVSTKSYSEDLDNSFLVDLPISVVEYIDNLVDKTQSYNDLSIENIKKDLVANNIDPKYANNIINACKIDINKIQTEVINQAKDLTSQQLKDASVIIATYSKESLGELLGNIRILQTNPTEVDEQLYDMLTDYGLNDDQIMLVAKMLDTPISKKIGVGANTFMDAIDIQNEVNLIHSLTSTHVTELSNTINQANDLLEGKIDDLTNNVDSVKEVVQNINQLVSNISQSISDKTNELSSSLDQLANSDVTTYDQKLIERNQAKAINYNKEFIRSLADDPLNALRDHSRYLSERLSTASIKTQLLNGTIKAIEFGLEVPKFISNGFSKIGSMISSLLSLALSTAAESITIIDNIDKISFIAEQFISIRNIYSSDIPSSFDEFFSKPTLTTNKDSYPEYTGQLKINSSNLSISTNSRYQSLIDQFANDGFVDNFGNVINIDRWDVSQFMSVLSSGLLMLIPKDSLYSKYDEGLPIILQNKEGGISLLPNTHKIGKIEYPQRGNYRIRFIKQVSNLFKLYPEVMTKFKYDEALSKSPYLPVTPDIVGVYSGFIIAASALAAATAVMGAGLRGDLFSMVAGAIAATASVASTNGIELARIVTLRTYVGSNGSIYDYLQSHKQLLQDDIDSLATRLSISSLLEKGYVQVVTDAKYPMVTDASDFKKFGIYLKEILFLISNTFTMAAASFMIGKITAKAYNTAKRMKVYRVRKQQLKNQKKQLKDNYSNLMSDYNKQIQDVNNDASLSEEEKLKEVKRIQGLQEDARDSYVQGLNVLPSNKQELWNVIARERGYNGKLPVSSANNSIAKAGNIGQKTVNALGSTIEQAKAYLQDTDSVDNSDVPIVESVNGILGSMTTLFNKIDKVEKDTQTIKKYT